MRLIAPLRVNAPGTTPTYVDAGITGAYRDRFSWANLTVMSTDAQAADKGGSIMLGGDFNGGTGITPFVRIAAGKDNSVAGEWGGYLSLGTRPHGGNMTERMRISSTGEIGIGIVPTTSYRVWVLQASSHTSGSGSYATRSQNNWTSAVDAASYVWGAHALAVLNQLSGTTLTNGAAEAVAGFVGEASLGGDGTFNANVAGICGIVRKAGAGNVTTIREFLAYTPWVTGGTVGSAMGLDIQPQKVTGVTNGWGVYQRGASDLNLFNGSVGIGVVPTATHRLNVERSSTQADGNVAATGASHYWTTAVDSADRYLSAAGVTMSVGPAAGTTVSNGAGNAIVGLNAAVTVTGAGTVTSPAAGIYASLTKYSDSSVTLFRSFTAGTPYIVGPGNITTAIGIDIQNQKVTGVANGYGVYQRGTADQNLFNGYVGLGITPTARLHLVADTTAAGGISFGGDVNLYRTSANIGRFDSYLHVSGGMGVGTAPTIQALISLPAGTTTAQGIRFGETFLYRSDANTLTTPILNLNKNEAQNLVTHKLAAAPGTPVEALRYYDTVMKKERYWDGTAWVDVGGGGAVTDVWVNTTGDTMTGNLALPTLSATTSISIGSPVASTGAIRLAPGAPIAWRHYTDTADDIIMAAQTGVLTLTGEGLQGWAIGTNPSTAGAVRLPNNQAVGSRLNPINLGSVLLLKNSSLNFTELSGYEGIDFRVGSSPTVIARLDSTGIDLLKFELRNAVTHKLATAPTTPVEGQRYYDTTLKVERYWNGATWVSTQFIQKGFNQPVTGADGFAVITFPVAYAAPPSIVLTPIRTGGAGSVIGVLGVGTVTATNFQVAQSGIGAGVSLNVLWVAIGDR